MPSRPNRTVPQHRCHPGHGQTGSAPAEPLGRHPGVNILSRRDLYEVPPKEFAYAADTKTSPAVTGVEGASALAVALAIQEAVSSGPPGCGCRQPMPPGDIHESHP